MNPECYNLDMNQRRRKVAIFDIDGTIFRSSLLIELTEAFIARRIFPKRARAAYRRERERWIDRRGSYADYIRGVIKAFERNVKGVRYEDFKKVAAEVVEAQKDRTYRFTRDLVRRLRKRGYYLLAISHSPKLAVDAFCKTLGFSKVYGLMYEVGEGGKFTGGVMYQELIFDKAQVLLRAVEKENLTLKGSVGVGDTETDIPFLSIVSRPVCFNPNSKLYAAARRRKWEVVVERKDVVYRLQ